MVFAVFCREKQLPIRGVLTLRWRSAISLECINPYRMGMCTLHAKLKCLKFIFGCIKLPPNSFRRHFLCNGSSEWEKAAVTNNVAKVRRNHQTCRVNLSGTTKRECTTPHSQLFIMQHEFYENENFTLK